MFCCIALMIAVIGYCFSCIGKLWAAAKERSKETSSKVPMIAILVIVLYVVGTLIYCGVTAAG